MDVPITLRFFEKLNLYQDIRRLDKKAPPGWENQRRILSWAGDENRHQHRAIELTVEMALEHDDITGLEGKYRDQNSASDKRNYIIHSCFGNLVSAGFAKWKNEDNWEHGIIFTREGFQAGEVINRLQTGLWARCAYFSSYVLSWALFVAAAVIAVGEAVKMVYEFVLFIVSHAGHCQLR
jgi:hypothetical protein